jgi:O-antigen/teichoic acid export membrane protein
MTGIGLTTLVLGQIDKFFISSKLPLDQLGLYSFGNYLGSSILIITGVIGNVLLPKLVEVVSKGNNDEIIYYYHKYTRLVASLITPLALFICFFSKEIILIWTGNLDTANKTYLIVSFVSFGALFNAYFTIPYYLMLSYGWTKLAIYQNIILSFIAIPLIIFSVQKFGIIGGTFLGIIGNISYVTISIPLIHNKFLHGELKKVYLNDLFPVIIFSLIPLFLYKLYYPIKISFMAQSVYFLILLFIMYSLIILFNKEYLILFKQLIKKTIK